MRFINPKIDFAFKKIFGSKESKDILISFLNALIYQENETIQDLEILDPYNQGSVLDLKDTYLDVKAILADASIVIIEMQVLNVESFDKRIVYNLAKTYCNQLKRGEGYIKLKPVIALTITNFFMFANNEKVINRFVFKEMDELFDYPKNPLEMVFVELPKFKKTLEELEKITDKWIFFIKNAPSLEVIPPSFSTVYPLEKALNIANQANLSVEELEEIQKKEIFLFDQEGGIKMALQEGRQEGLQQGRQEGLQQGEKKGEKKGKIALILRILNKKIGTISPEIKEQIGNLSLEKLDILTDDVLEFNSLDSLTNWLDNN